MKEFKETDITLGQYYFSDDCCGACAITRGQNKQGPVPSLPPSPICVPQQSKGLTVQYHFYLKATTILQGIDIQLRFPRSSTLWVDRCSHCWCVRVGADSSSGWNVPLPFSSINMSSNCFTMKLSLLYYLSVLEWFSVGSKA